jgi:rod shape-determining protein MreC
MAGWRRSPLTAVVVVACVLLLLQAMGMLPRFGWMTKMLAPAQGGAYAGSVGIGSWWDVVSRGTAVIDERDYWQQQATAAVVEKAELLELRQQVAGLGAVAKLAAATPYPTVAARILGAPAGGRVGSRIIDAGADVGVAVGQPVLSPDGGMVGVVSEVWSTGATVLLLDSPQSRLAAVPLGKQSSGGIVSGVPDLGLLLTSVRPDEDLAVGDIVGTAGTQPGLPRGLPIGVVREVWRRDGELFQTAVLEPLADTNRLLTVAVLITSPR